MDSDEERYVQRIREGQPFWTHPVSQADEQRYWRRIRRKLRPLRTNWRQFKQRMRMRREHLRHRDTERLHLFIIAEGRSGSNLIVNYLSSVPGVAATEEVFNRTSPIGLRSWWITKGISLRHLTYSLAMPGKIVVAKLPPHHLRWQNLTYEEICAFSPNARFIVLYRQDLLSQYVSWCKLFLTGQDRYRAGHSTTGKITVDREHFLEFCRRMKSSYEHVAKAEILRERSAVVTYEELSTSPQEVFDERLFPLLGVASVPIRTNFQKQDAWDLEQRIENFDAVSDLMNDPVSRMTFEWESDCHVVDADG